MTETTETYERVAIERILPSKTNPRTHFDAVYLATLGNSILEKGIIEPLIVRPIGKKDQLEIVAGECRYRASKDAGLTQLPCLVRTLTDEQALEIQLIENLHRHDLTPLEEASGFRALINSNPDKHSAASIAARIGKSPSWVWDLMKLLDLVPDAKQLLEDGRITAGHAILIARLTPDQQKRVINPSTEALFEDEAAWLPDVEPKQKVSKYDGWKVRTINELKDWIANHIRFDVAQMAKAAPLEFEPVAEQVQAATEKPGRGRKMVPITFEHVCPYNAKDESQRTYGSTAWKRADGKEKSKTCEHAVLGVVAAGSEGYGEAFDVCIARDKCLVHWSAEVKARQKTQKLREQGKTAQADRREKKQQESYDQKYEREEKARKARESAWGAIAKFVIADAVAQVKPVKALTAKIAEVLIGTDGGFDRAALKEHLGAQWFKTPVAALLVSLVGGFHYHTWGSNKESGFDQFVKEVAQPLGLDVKRLAAIRDKHQPVEALQKSGVKAKKAAKAKTAA